MESMRASANRFAAQAGAALFVLAASGAAGAGQLSFLAAEVQGGIDGADGLDVAVSIAVSPDGRHVYAAGYGDNAVSVFARVGPEGILLFLETQKDGVAGVDGLAGAYSVAISPDGKHVYVAGNLEDAIAVFSRDPTSGHLTFAEVEKNGVGGVAGLAAIDSLAVSPDGKHVYAAGYNDNAIAVFSRNATTGSLGFVEAKKNGVAGVQGLGGASSVTVSSDGKHVYATGLNDDAVAVFSRNPTTGSLGFVEADVNGVAGIEGLGGANSVAVSPDGKNVYVAGPNDNAVAFFSRNPTSGSLSFLQAQIDGNAGVQGLRDVQAVTVSPDGAYVYAAAHTGDGAVTVFRRLATTGGLNFVESEKNGLGYADGIGIATAVAVSPDGRNVYATGTTLLGDGALAAFAPGVLSFLQVKLYDPDLIAGLAGISSAVVSPDGKHVYTTGYDGNAISLFARSATSGSLSFVESQSSGVAGVQGLGGARSVIVSPDGKHVYAAGFLDNALAVFARNAATGALSFVEYQQDGVAGVDGLAGAHSVAISPDGKHVFVAGFEDSAVAVFSRNPTSGHLSFVEVDKNGVGGVAGLGGIDSVAVSPDGKHVYAAGYDDNAIAVFSRNPTTGSLSFVEIEKNGVAGVQGLGGAEWVSVSPDGRHVYAAAYYDSAVAIFGRDAASGSLAFVGFVADGVAGVHGIHSASSVQVSPDGGTVYARGTDATLAVFHRDPASGNLAFFQLEQNGLAGVNGLAGGDISCALSPDGRNVYANGSNDSALVVFAPEPGRGLAAAALSTLAALACRRQRGSARPTKCRASCRPWYLS